MHTKDGVLYYRHFTPLFRAYLVARLAPYYLLHFFFHPFRRDLPAIGYKRSHTTNNRRRLNALIDALIHIMIKGYSELVGAPLPASTGQMLLFLGRVVKSIDERFEQRVRAGVALDLTELMAEPSLEEPIQVLQAYLDCFGRRDVVMKHFSAFYAKHYPAYASCPPRLPQHEWPFSVVLASAHFDSGMMVRAMFALAALFAGHQLTDGVLEEFYHVGMVGKFADDMVDLVRDMHLGAPNLVYALVQKQPSELQALIVGIQSHAKRSAAWWQQHCPTTYTQLFAHIAMYRSRVRAPHLKLVCHLCLLPLMSGGDYDLADEWESSASVR